MDHTGPRAALTLLIREEVDGELVIYDQRTDRMTRLNHSAAAVWRACDGHRSPAELLFSSNLRWANWPMRTSSKSRSTT